MYFDVTDLKVDVCFGSPDMHPFETVSFDEPAGITLFDVAYENEYPDNPQEFWRVV
jgi:hypothetical protein